MSPVVVSWARTIEAVLARVVNWLLYSAKKHQRINYQIIISSFYNQISNLGGVSGIFVITRTNSRVCRDTALNRYWDFPETNPNIFEHQQHRQQKVFVGFEIELPLIRFWYTNLGILIYIFSQIIFQQKTSSMIPQLAPDINSQTRRFSCCIVYWIHIPICRPNFKIMNYHETGINSML